MSLAGTIALIIVLIILVGIIAMVVCSYWSNDAPVVANANPLAANPAINPEQVIEQNARNPVPEEVKN